MKCEQNPVNGHQACPRRIQELALPNLHVVVGVLRDHFRTLGKDRVHRLEALRTQIERLSSAKLAKIIDGIRDDFEIFEIFTRKYTKRSIYSIVTRSSLNSFWSLESSRSQVDEVREIINIPNGKVIVSNKKIPRVDFEAYSYKVMDAGEVQDCFMPEGGSQIQSKTSGERNRLCRRKIEIVGRVEKSTVLIQIHVAESSKGIFVEVGLDDLNYTAITLRFHEINIIPLRIV